MGESKIQWTDRVWNPIRGCSVLSAGCRNCYAMRQAHRFSGPGGAYEGLTQLSRRGPVWTGTARFVPEMLDEPLRWKKPARIFVNSMSDLFHDDVSFQEIAAVFGVMWACPQHTFQILTKRPARMLKFFCWISQMVGTDNLTGQREAHAVDPVMGCHIQASRRVKLGSYMLGERPHVWPLRNVWLGVSCENQEAADERIPLLLETPAAVRFVSAEPLLGPIDLGRWIPSPIGMEPEAISLDWVIVGGESGQGARICELDWIRSVVFQCAKQRVSCFVKQVGGKPALSVEPTGEFRTHNGRRQFKMNVSLLPVIDRKGGDMAEWPADLRIRQFPEVPHV